MYNVYNWGLGITPKTPSGCQASLGTTQQSYRLTLRRSYNSSYDKLLLTILSMSVACESINDTMGTITTWISLGGAFKRPRPLATPIVDIIVSYSYNSDVAPLVSASQMTRNVFSHTHYWPHSVIQLQQWCCSFSVSFSNDKKCVNLSLLKETKQSYQFLFIYLISTKYPGYYKWWWKALTNLLAYKKNEAYFSWCELSTTIYYKMTVDSTDQPTYFLCTMLILVDVSFLSPFIHNKKWFISRCTKKTPYF